MIDKRVPVFYAVLVGFFISIMTILMILLFVEYRFFCRQVAELSLLKQQYSYYIDVLDRKINGITMAVDEVGENGDDENNDDSDEVSEEMGDGSSIMLDEISAAESSDAPDNDDEYADDSFVVINRHPDYLKQSTLDYIESQELNALMTTIDIDRWSDYAPVETDRPKRINKPGKNKSATLVTRTVDSMQKREQKISAIRRPAKDCGFIWPIDGDKFWLSSLFGPRKRIDGTWGFHHGVDMAAIKGTVVKAVRAGTVVEAAFQAGYGNTVVIKHNENIKTRYAHLHSIRVHVGQKVKQETMVGTVGETGFIRKKGKDGSHLHFEVYEYGKRINPLQCLPRI
jgi:murein DD-endopeptidase MepM/ murein hydrolase activator NlpD